MLLATPRAEAQALTLPQVTVASTRANGAAQAEAGALLPWLGHSQSSSELDRETLDRWQPRRLEDLVGLMPGATTEPLNAGLSTGLTVRGFSLTRLHYGGLPDVQRMFNRDLSTVERVEFVRGPAAALLGITSPGGVVNYIGKRPLATPATVLGLAAGNDAFVRGTLDSTGPIGGHGAPLRYRIVASAEDGHTRWAGLPTRRQQAMGVLEWHYGAGLLGVDLQEQRNQTPFTFGTVITNQVLPGQPVQKADVAWDRLLVAEGGAPAMRRYHDMHLRWEHRLGPAWALRAVFGQAVVTRDETLRGFWTITSPTTVSSYYTRYHDSYIQRSGRLELATTAATGALRHDLRFGVDGYRQGVLFEGVQNIGGAVVGIKAPDFSNVDPSRLALSRRFTDERLKEEGLWLADKVTLPNRVEASLAVRRQSYSIDFDRSGAGRRPVASAAATTWHAGLSLPLGGGWRGWLSQSTGMEANRGNTRDGGFLEPQQSRQNEIGVEHAAPGSRASLALWQIDLRNLATVDPLDRTAVVSAGRRKAEGVEALFAHGAGPWSVQGNLTVQRTRQVVPTSARLGDRFVGVPDASGGVQLRRQTASIAGAPVDVWAGLAAVGARMANAENTVRVAGYVRFDAGASVALGTATQLQMGLRNVGDIRYVESVTALDNVYQGSRRQWWVGLRTRL